MVYSRHRTTENGSDSPSRSVRAVLNGKTYELHAGDVVVIPAGTVIRGRNTGNQEARVVVGGVFLPVKYGMDVAKRRHRRQVSSEVR